MKKKVVSVALAAALTAGVLAGCGGGSSKEIGSRQDRNQSRG